MLIQDNGSFWGVITHLRPIGLWILIWNVPVTSNPKCLDTSSIVKSGIHRSQVHSFPHLWLSWPVSDWWESGIHMKLSGTVNFNSPHLSRNLTSANCFPKSEWYLTHQLYIVTGQKVVFHEILKAKGKCNSTSDNTVKAYACVWHCMVVYM